jgi:peptide/nickel transport system ATP-binding protein
VPRCPLASDVCIEQRPPLRPVDGSLAACHHAERVSAL